MILNQIYSRGKAMTDERENKQTNKQKHVKSGSAECRRQKQLFGTFLYGTT